MWTSLPRLLRLIGESGACSNPHGPSTEQLLRAGGSCDQTHSLQKVRRGNVTKVAVENYGYREGTTMENRGLTLNGSQKSSKFMCLGHRWKVRGKRPMGTRAHPYRFYTTGCCSPLLSPAVATMRTRLASLWGGHILLPVLGWGWWSCSFADLKEKDTDSEHCNQLPAFHASKQEECVKK